MIGCFTYPGILVAIAITFLACACDADEPEFAARQSAATAASDLLFEDVHVVSLPREQHGYRGALGDLVQLKDGRLLAAFSPPNPAGAIQACYSSDLGKTWDKPFTLVPAPRTSPGKDLYMLPGFVRLSNGDILLSYMYVSQIRPFYFAPTFYRRSIDEGKSWGDQLLLTPAANDNQVHNDKLVQLSSGRLITPVAHELDGSGDDHRGYISYSFYSDDNGYSWRKSDNEINMLPVEAQEPHVVELKDGRLMMLMRTYHRYVARAYSTDQGVTWSKGEAVPELVLSANSSAINVTRIPRTGDLLLVRTTAGEGGRRTPFVATISQDEGKTWIKERVIAGDPDEDYGYPSITFVDDLVLIFYHHRDGIHLARIGTDWFYEQSAEPVN